MSNPKWNKGAPPSIGWWPASISKDSEVVRFWNGQFWSDDLRPEASVVSAGIHGNRRAETEHEIEWTERWWL